MANKSTQNKNMSDFRELIPEYNDEQIRAIILKRSQYEQEAADLAIKEAIKRGIIHSEQDLFSEEFTEKKVRILLFPKIEDQKVKNKTRKSIARVLLIIGAIPLVWGILETFKGHFVEGILLAVLGTVWIYCSFKLLQKMEIRVIPVFFVMLLASLYYIVSIFLQMRGLLVMDYLIPVIMYLFVIYGLLFLRRLR